MGSKSSKPTYTDTEISRLFNNIYSISQKCLSDTNFVCKIGYKKNHGIYDVFFVVRFLEQKDAKTFRRLLRSKHIIPANHTRGIYDFVSEGSRLIIGINISYEKNLDNFCDYVNPLALRGII